MGILFHLAGVKVKPKIQSRRTNSWTVGLQLARTLWGAIARLLSRAPVQAGERRFALATLRQETTRFLKRFLKSLTGIRFWHRRAPPPIQLLKSGDSHEKAARR